METGIDALDEAINLATSQHALASLIQEAAVRLRPDARYGQQHIAMWRQRNSVPVDACPLIERVTRNLGCAVVCERLRPDVDWAVLRLQIEA